MVVSRRRAVLHFPHIVLKNFPNHYNTSFHEAPQAKNALRDMCLQFLSSAFCKKQETVSTVSANVTNLQHLMTQLILTSPCIQNTSQSVHKNKMNFLNLSDQNFSLVIVLSFFFKIFWQISACVFL